jgi:UDP-2-acetamido-3-amino-2,3-dideoxy-glucuronate N-acetyltransferase
LGANCTIVCGVTIGAHSFVGAGAVINRNVPDYALMLGVPARRRGWMCQCGAQLKGQGDVRCSCGAAYRISESVCAPL